MNPQGPAPRDRRGRVRLGAVAAALVSAAAALAVTGVAPLTGNGDHPDPRRAEAASTQSVVSVDAAAHRAGVDAPADVHAREGHPPPQRASSGHEPGAAHTDEPVEEASGLEVPALPSVEPDAQFVDGGHSDRDREATPEAAGAADPDHPDRVQRAQHLAARFPDQAEA